MPQAPAFAIPKHWRAAEMIREDLAAAQIPEKDAIGRVVDFHALRHTFITNLARSQVHPKTAHVLARHSSITLTLDRYTHSLREDEVRALESLPDSGGTAAQATGTDGRALRRARTRGRTRRPTRRLYSTATSLKEPQRATKPR